MAELTYTRVDDYYIPDLILDEERSRMYSMASMATCGATTSGSIGPSYGMDGAGEQW